MAHKAVLTRLGRLQAACGYSTCEGQSARRKTRRLHDRFKITLTHCREKLNPSKSYHRTFNYAVVLVPNFVPSPHLFAQSIGLVCSTIHCLHIRIMFKNPDSFSTAFAPSSRQSTAAHPATFAASASGAFARTSDVVDSSSSAAADVTNLFARFGSTDGAMRYRELHSDADAAAAAARWPLLAEWLAVQSPAQPPDHPTARPNAEPRE